MLLEVIKCSFPSKQTIRGPKGSGLSESRAVCGSPGISVKIQLLLVYGPNVMATPVGRSGSSPYFLPDLRMRPGRSFLYTGRMAPVITKAACSGSDPTMTVAEGNIALLLLLKQVYMASVQVTLNLLSY